MSKSFSLDIEQGFRGKVPKTFPDSSPVTLKFVSRATDFADSDATEYSYSAPVNYYYVGNPTLTDTQLVSGSSWPSEVAKNDTFTSYFEALNGKTLPPAITVAGASYTWTQSTGKLVISNPSDNISVSITGVEPPTKGETITMSLGEPPFISYSTDGGVTWTDCFQEGEYDTYKVLSISGTTATILAMYQYSGAQFDRESTRCDYIDGILDNLLNDTYYNELSTEAKNAIVASSIIVREPESTGTYSSTHASIWDLSEVGSSYTRNVYAIEVGDIETYFGGSYYTTGTFSKTDVVNLTGVGSSKLTSFWTRDQEEGYARAALVNGNGMVNTGAIIYSGGGHDKYAVRPVFKIDLTKIGWGRPTE